MDMVTHYNKNIFTDKMAWCCSDILEDGAEIKISFSQARLLKYKYGKEVVRTSLTEKEVRYVILASVMYDIVNSSNQKMFIICKNKAEVVFYHMLLQKLMLDSGFSNDKIKAGKYLNSTITHDTMNGNSVIFSVISDMQNLKAKMLLADAIYAYIPKNANNKSVSTIASLSANAGKVLILTEKEDNL